MLPQLCLLPTMLLASGHVNVQQQQPLPQQQRRSTATLSSSIVATVWLRPTGLPSGTAFHEKGSTFWANDTQWKHYLGVRDRDAWLLKASLGGHPNATAILYFENYLADAGVWGSAPAQRLASVVAHFAAHGVASIVFFGDPEFSGRGGWDSTHDVVRNATARAYLHANIARVLGRPGIAGVVQHVSVYWVGSSKRCTGAASKPACTESQITEYNTELYSLIKNSGAQFLLHVDGPFWNGCWPAPCPHWNVAGYSPASIAASRVTGLLGESWAMGSLQHAVETLRAACPLLRDVLLLNDVPNCDLDQAKKCSTGSLQSDDEDWFNILGRLGLNRTWGVWDFADGGVGDANDYGDAKNDGSGLTTKGKLHAARAAQIGR
jgi:hypothetical protein